MLRNDKSICATKASHVTRQMQIVSNPDVKPEGRDATSVASEIISLYCAYTIGLQHKRI